MGVPALFRWLSKKYPKIVSAVEEEQPRKVPRQDGEEGEEELPIDMSRPNPNGEEFDCLYLDMNGIVHPCTHPEGKAAPETEEEMMVEVFAYTERVVNMVRPRKLLMMAIDGVAPRAKMNQQRSRRFRAAQEAKEKQEEKDKALEEWKARGMPVTDEAADNKKAWDSNAITPGTPFMDLLAASLRYWVAQKLNTDPGWKNLQVIISDASVPGEGEHKIMDFIRRQRVQPAHDPNTKHVIYGLDADLIMLSLATHEPYFKVLREDVFAQEQKVRTCHRCGREGHIAANCIGEARPKQGEHDDVGAKPVDKKPFIFLDVVALREYLAIELNIPNLPFAFDLERAIDDWVFLIFFVGNDFLPHLPSLEIREGAIDILLRIWKRELPRMGSYLTNHGKVEMKNAQLIMEGIAQEEDEIFRKRKQQEERQEANAVRRKEEDVARQRRQMEREGVEYQHGGVSYVEAKKARHEAPAAANGDDQLSAEEQALKEQAIAALESGKSEDIIANQRAIRMANLSAAERLKAEMKGAEAAQKGAAATTVKAEEIKAEEIKAEEIKAEEIKAEEIEAEEIKAEEIMTEESGDTESATRGQKRKAEEVEQEELKPTVKEEMDVADQEVDEEADEDKTALPGQEDVDPITSTVKERKVNEDGTVEYEDTVKLWEPGYRQRYYEQKFGVEADTEEFRRHVAKCYMEGMSWVLAYYYQGCPSWTWYFPYHFSPFAADFTRLEEFKIEFQEGKPFRPYDQLMGVLPAASRIHLPDAFHPLMTDEESEIIDFYPEDFSIDMNGKKMAWQGVALLPFIDEKRLLKAIEGKYGQLSEDELRRNQFGHQALLVGEQNGLYDDICALYARKREDQATPVAVDPAHSAGISGFIRADPDCVPNSTYVSPLTSVGLTDILNDRSISALYDFPPQTTPHRSVLLKGLRMPKSVLTHEDREFARRGGDGRGRGRGRGGGRFNSGSYNHHSMHMDEQQQQQQRGQNGGRGGRWGGQGEYATRGQQGYPQPHHQQQQQQRGYGGGGYGGYGGAPAQGGGYRHNQGGGYGQGGAQGGGLQSFPPQEPAATPYGGQYGGYSGYGGGYGAAAPPNGGAYGAPPAAPAAAGAYGAYGGYGGYGQAAPPQGQPNNGYGGHGAGQYGSYGGYGGYGGQAIGYPPANNGYGPPGGQGGGAFGGGAAAPPRPLGYHQGGHGGGRGGRGGAAQGGPYGRY